ncbi:hypothetical protein N9878_00340 [bacterium]|nr:hypothetical protein [bacterium]
MAKPTKAEILELLKDPELLKEAGLQTVASKTEDELFSDIVVSDDDTMSDVVKKINDRQRKQRDYMKKRDADVLKEAKELSSKGEKDRAQAEVDSFLKKHPELTANKDLLAIVDPLYQNGMDLEDAFKKGCKSLDLDPSTGKAPVVDDDETGKPGDKTTKKPALRTDQQAPVKKVDDADDVPDTPLSIREAASANLNKLAAKGENPWSSQTGD